VSLIVAAAVAPVLAAIAFTALSDDVLLTRYTAVAAPFMVVLIAGAAASMPRAAGLGLGTAALACALAGSLHTHRREAFHPDVRGAYGSIRAGYRAGDVIAASGNVSIGPVTEYYRRRLLPASPAALLPANRPELDRSISQRRRLWLVGPAATPATLRGALAPIGYTPRRTVFLEGEEDLVVALAVPDR
jgi:hypothetical protein